MKKIGPFWKSECNTFISNNIVGKQILDIGCGAYPHPKATLTLDAIEEVRIRDRVFRPDVVADINEHIPLPDNYVDCIIMNNVLEHVHNPKNTLAECRRVLKRGGVLLVTVPFLVKIHQEPIDYHRYTIYMLELLFKDFQYKITPSKHNLTYLYTITQNSLFGMIGKKKHPVGFVISRIIKILTLFLPEVSEESYPYGYLVSGRK